MRREIFLSFGDQPDGLDGHSRINCLAHVVESQCSHGDCSQSFHLYAGGAPAGHFRSNSEGSFLQLDIHINVVEVEIVAERD